MPNILTSCRKLLSLICAASMFSSPALAEIPQGPPRVSLNEILPLVTADKGIFSFVAKDAARGQYSISSEGNPLNTDIDPDTGHVKISPASRTFSNAKVTILLKNGNNVVDGPFQFTLVSAAHPNPQAKLIASGSKVEISKIPNLVKLQPNGNLEFFVRSDKRPKILLKWGEYTPDWAQVRIQKSCDPDTGLFNYKNSGNHFLSHLCLSTSSMPSRQFMFTVLSEPGGQTKEFDTLSSGVPEVPSTSNVYVFRNQPQILAKDPNHPELAPTVVAAPRKSIVANELDLGVHGANVDVFNELKNIDSKVTEIEICAHKITLRESLVLPGVSVSINAKVLKIQSGAKLNTSGRDGNSQDRNGANGGNIFLNVGELLVAHGEHPLFVANGGKGLRGVAGVNGIDCADPPKKTVLSDSEYNNVIASGDEAAVARVRNQLHVPDNYADGTIWVEQQGATTPPWPQSTEESFPGEGGAIQTLPESSGNGGAAGTIRIKIGKLNGVDQSNETDQLKELFSSNGGKSEKLSSKEREVRCGFRGEPTNARRIKFSRDSAGAFHLVEEKLTDKFGYYKGFVKPSISASEKTCVFPPNESIKEKIVYKCVSDSSDGETKTLNLNGTAWQTEPAMKAHLSYLRDQYLFLNLNDAGKRKQFRSLIDVFVSDCSASGVPAEIGKLKLDAEHLSSLEKSELDLYGNPKNWAPLLSLEATHSALSAELKSDLKSLFLCKKVRDTYRQAQVRQQMFSELRDQLRQTLPEYQKIVTDAKDKLNLSANELQRAEIEQTAIITDLNNYIAEKRAKSGTFLSNLLKGVSVLAAVGAAFVPGGQVATAAIFTTIGTVAAAGNQIVTAIDSGFKNGLNDVVSALSSLGNVDLGISVSVPQSLVQFADDVKVLRQKLDQTKQWIATSIPNRDVAEKFIADLHNKAGNNRTLKAKVERAEVCYEKRAAVAEQCSDDLTNISSASEVLATAANSLKMADAVLADQSMQITAEVEQGLSDLERSITDRLQHYFYMMKAAYEYGRVEPYKSTLLLSKLYQEFDRVASTASFDENKAIDAFLQCLNEVRADVILGANSKTHLSPPNVAAIVLNQKQLDTLNERLNRRSATQNEPIPLNLRDSLPYDFTAENLRINEFVVKSSDARFKDGEGFAKIPLQIRVIHPGKSILTKDGKIYSFNHGTEMKYPLLLLDPNSATPSSAKAEDSSATSLYRYFAGNLTTGVDVFSRRGVMNEIKLEVFPRAPVPPGNRVELTHLQLGLTYLYSDPSATRCWLDVRTSKEIKPYFEVSRDVSGKTAGYGGIIAQYQRGQNVVVKASPAYGKYVFTKWTNAAGEKLNYSGDEFTLQVPMNTNTVVIANYAEL